jgi:hypothetical protein
MSEAITAQAVHTTTFRMTLHYSVSTENLALGINKIQADINSADTMVSVYKVVIMKRGPVIACVRHGQL